MASGQPHVSSTVGSVTGTGLGVQAHPHIGEVSMHPPREIWVLAVNAPLSGQHALNCDVTSHSGTSSDPTSALSIDLPLKPAMSPACVTWEGHWPGTLPVACCYCCQAPPHCLLSQPQKTLLEWGCSGPLAQTSTLFPRGPPVKWVSFPEGHCPLGSKPLANSPTNLNQRCPPSTPHGAH